MLNKILKYSKEIDQSAIYRLVNNINVTKELCLEIVKHNGYALRYINLKLRDKEICLEAVRQHGGALAFVPMELRDENMCAVAAEQNTLALLHFPKLYII
jgi:hypothetical protein